MSYEWIDALTYYLYGLRGLTWVLAISAAGAGLR